MTYCVYLAHTGSRGLHINKENAKRFQCKACKGYLLADWSNLILHIHDDYC